MFLDVVRWEVIKRAALRRAPDGTRLRASAFKLLTAMLASAQEQEWQDNRRIVTWPCYRELTRATALIAFGLIASAVCGLLGPIFVPFFIVPKLDWLFWGWLKSFIQYSFIPVVAIAFLMFFERFVFRYVTSLPPTVTTAEFGVYGLQAVAVVMTFCVGIILVPSLTSSIFSGTAGESILPRTLNPGNLFRRG